MAIRPHDLNNPEDFERLENRETGGPEPVRKPLGPTAELKALRERIAALRDVPPPPTPNVDRYGKDWWKRGWAAGYAAALEAVEKD
jgi:hypothetical protein